MNVTKESREDGENKTNQRGKNQRQIQRKKYSRRRQKSGKRKPTGKVNKGTRQNATKKASEDGERRKKAASLRGRSSKDQLT